MRAAVGRIELPQEIQQLKEATAEFIDRRVLPREAEIGRSGEFPSELRRDLASLGYFGLTIPEEYGGAGLSFLGCCAIQEELARAPKVLWSQVMSSNITAGRILSKFGTGSQKRNYLPRIALGELLPAIAVTEPEAGSDVQGLKTRAEKTGEGWRINGSKHFITFGARADILFLLARTGPKEAGSKAFTLFLIERGMPGLKVARMQENMAGLPIEQAELLFEDLEVGDEHVVGGEGNGLKTMFSTLAEERLAVGATCAGVAQRAIELGVEYAGIRKTFGNTLSSYQVIQHSLADSAIELFATRAMMFELARQHDQRPIAPHEAAILKVYAAEMGWRVVDRVLQIFGGAGYMAEMPICRMYREIRVLRISGGASEIQRNLIAKHMLEA